MKVAPGVERFKIDRTPIAAVGAAGKLWVGDQLGDALYEIDPSSGRTIRKLKLSRNPDFAVDAVAHSGARLWVAYGNGADPSGEHVRSVDVRSGALGPARSSAQDDVVSAAATSNAVYVGGKSTISRVTVAGARPVVYTIPHSDLSSSTNVELTAMAATRSGVWAALWQSQVPAPRLVRYDPRTLRPVQSIDLSALFRLDDVVVTSLLAEGNSVWAASAEGPVLRISGGRVTARISFPDITSALLADRTGVWVVEVRDAKLDHISTASGKVDETITVAGTNLGVEKYETPHTTLAAVPGQLWVTDFLTGTAYRVPLTRH